MMAAAMVATQCQAGGCCTTTRGGAGRWSALRDLWPRTCKLSDSWMKGFWPSFASTRGRVRRCSSAYLTVGESVKCPKGHFGCLALSSTPRVSRKTRAFRPKAVLGLWALFGPLWALIYPAF